MKLISICDSLLKGNNNQAFLKRTAIKKWPVYNSEERNKSLTTKKFDLHPKKSLLLDLVKLWEQSLLRVSPQNQTLKSCKYWPGAGIKACMKSLRNWSMILSPIRTSPDLSYISWSGKKSYWCDLITFPKSYSTDVKLSDYYKIPSKLS